MSASKPKIHRLPVIKPRKRLFTSKYLLVLSGALTMFGVITLAASNLDITKVFAATNPRDADRLLSQASRVLPSPVSDAVAASFSEKQGKTIVIRGSSGTIIGQMAKIPAESEQITEIKTVSHIDNGAGRELLSIISKY